jgi:hypothetical protein
MKSPRIKIGFHKIILEPLQGTIKNLPRILILREREYEQGISLVNKK